ncbi:MAG: vWA domain-containing protein [Acidimicrobiales bacterium]
MTALDRDQLAAARLWATSRQPYLATALFAVQVAARPGIGTIAADPRWRLYVDPDVAARLDAQELGRVVTHLVSHLLRGHAKRAGDPPRPHWLLGADFEVNDDLASTGLLPEPAPDHPDDVPLRTGQLAEWYGEQLQDQQAYRRGWLDCGSGADGCRRPWDGSNGLSERECGLLCKTVAHQMCRHAGRFPGTVPGGWLRWAEQTLRPQVDWRKVLRAEVRRAVASVAGAVDYTYRRPSRREEAVDDVILPALHRPQPEVVVVCDTSGSMHDRLLARARAEVEGLLTAQGLRRQLRVLAVDTHVHALSRVTAARQVALAGGGGTDMGAGIEAALALRPPADVVVVLTDGYTPWPGRAPPVRVVVGLLQPDGHPQAPWAPPDWARTVHIGSADGLTAP